MAVLPMVRIKPKNRWAHDVDPVKRLFSGTPDRSLTERCIGRLDTTDRQSLTWSPLKLAFEILSCQHIIPVSGSNVQQAELSGAVGINSRVGRCRELVEDEVMLDGKVAW